MIEERDGLCGICPAGCWVRAQIEGGRLVQVTHPLREVQKYYAVIGAAFIPLLALVLLVLNGRAAWVGAGGATPPTPLARGGAPQPRTSHRSPRNLHNDNPLEPPPAGGDARGGRHHHGGWVKEKSGWFVVEV